MHVQQVSAISRAALTACSEKTLREATAPYSIIEMIVNFFSFGGVRRANELFYRQFYDALSSYCASNVDDSFSKKPFHFSFQTELYRIEISRTQSSHLAPFNWNTQVNVITLKDGSLLNTEISDVVFVRACEVLSVRAWHNNICQYAPLFTESGLKNFENLHMETLTLSENMYSNASFNGSVIDWLTLKDVIIETTTFDSIRVNKTFLVENVTGMGLSFLNASFSEPSLFNSKWHCCDLAGFEISKGFFVSSHFFGCYGAHTHWRGVSAYDTTLQSCSLIEPEFSTPYGLRHCFHDSYIRNAYYKGCKGTRCPIENRVLFKTC